MKLINSSLGKSEFKDKPLRLHDHIYLSDPPEKTKSAYIQIGKIINREFKKKKFILNKKIINICDMGCATGDFAYYLIKKFPKSNVLGVDFYDELIKKANLNYGRSFKNRLKFKKGSILISKTLTNEKFDILTVVGVLSIFDNIKPALKNCIKWLKPGGMLIVFNMFNFFDLDIFIRFRDHKEKNLQTGWNIFSEKNVKKTLLSLGARKIHIYKFKVNFKRLQRLDDPLRCWSVEVDGERKMLNGLNILHPFKILTCIKKKI